VQLGMHTESLIGDTMSRIKSRIDGVLKAVSRECGSKKGGKEVSLTVDCLMKRLEIYLVVLDAIGVPKVAEIRTKETANAIGTYLSKIIQTNEKDRLLFANALLKYAKHDYACLALKEEYSENTCTCGLITYKMAASKAVLNPAGIPLQLLK